MVIQNSIFLHIYLYCVCNRCIKYIGMIVIKGYIINFHGLSSRLFSYQ